MDPVTDTKVGIDQIREILVGAIARDLERRLARAESHFAARAAEIEQEARRRMEMIETHLKKELDTLGNRVDAEAVETKEAVRTAQREHRDVVTLLEQRIAKLEDSVLKGQHILRQQMLDQAKSFLDELRSMRTELNDTLERELGMLDGNEGEEALPRAASDRQKGDDSLVQQSRS
jgi:hypothetical protein